MSAPSVEIAIIVDNRAGEGLVSEHGLSLLVRAGERRVLLDTGQGPALKANAAALGVDLSKIDTLVVSHGHYDHTGGIPLVVRNRPELDIYLHAGALRKRFTIDERGTRSIGIPLESLRSIEQAEGRKLHVVKGSVEISETMGVTAPIERVTEYEDPGGPFFLDAVGRVPDAIEDDLALWIRTDEGLILLVGCCHAGVINTLRHACRDAGEERIRAIIGGLHLLHADHRRLGPTMSALAELSPEQIVACHCTGDNAIRALRDTLGSRVDVGISGLVLRYGAT